VGGISKGTFVFVVPGSKVPASLTYVHLSTIRASEFVDTGACEFVLVLWVKRLRIVLFVRKPICRFECLNKFVIYVVSLPVYVKVVHLCLLCGGWCGECCFGVCRL
jgi:hypothetical protein